jgi:hypothetical protein
VFGDVETLLLDDAPHDFSWREEIDGEEVTFHRKGACLEAMSSIRSASFNARADLLEAARRLDIAPKSLADSAHNDLMVLPRCKTLDP